MYGNNEEYNCTGKPMSVAMITGADLMVKKILIDKVGGFNPLFFMYYEDTELCYRIKNEGKDIMSVPEAKIYHLEGGSFTKDKRINRLIMSRRSLTLYLEVTHGKHYAGIVNFIWKMLIDSRVFYYAITNSSKKDFWISVKDKF